MRTAPSRYYVSPRITVDVHRGDDLGIEDALCIVESGGKVVLRSEEAARGVLAGLGTMDQEQIDSAIRFGQTGRV